MKKRKLLIQKLKSRIRYLKEDRIHFANLLNFEQAKLQSAAIGHTALYLRDFMEENNLEDIKEKAEKITGVAIARLKALGITKEESINLIKKGY